MTGFGLADSSLGVGRVVVEARAVNARYLEVRLKLPSDLVDFTAYLEGEVRRRLSRGRIDVGVRSEGAVLPPPPLDRARAREAYRALCDLRDEIAPGAEVPFSMLTALPDLFGAPLAERFEAAREALGRALGGALDGMERMRETEGAALATDLQRRTLALRSLVARLEDRAPAVVVATGQRLRDRLGRLLGSGTTLAPGAASTVGQSPAIDAGRLEQEVALLADRADVTEELTRLKSHLEQFLVCLESSEPVGRKLDFLLQEMMREINTAGAKSQDAAMARLVVDAKAEIDRMREQVQNVE